MLSLISIVMVSSAVFISGPNTVLSQDMATLKYALPVLTYCAANMVHVYCIEENNLDKAMERFIHSEIGRGVRQKIIERANKEGEKLEKDVEQAESEQAKRKQDDKQESSSGRRSNCK